MVRRIAFALAVGAGLLASVPASAQFFLKPVDLRSERVTGNEPGITGPALPGASVSELRAALVWNLRAALNVAALQCQFEPTLLTLGNYNALLADHEGELKDSYQTLEKYFIRVSKSKKEGQNELDRFGTRIYSGFSTVSGQLSFCQTASSIGQAALFARRGQLGELAQDRMAELRKSLAAWGEQHRPGAYAINIFPEPLPPFANDRCWKRDVYNEKRCGPLPSRAGLAGL